MYSLGCFYPYKLNLHQKTWEGGIISVPEIRKVNFRDGMLPRLHHQQVAKPRSGFRNV